MPPTSDSSSFLTARPTEGDPLTGALSRPTRVGMIAIEPATRRRMRLNGLMRADGDGLSMALHQVYANCPKYIHKRTVEEVVAREDPSARPAPTTTTVLTQRQQQWIRGADTFFISSRSSNGDADCSHRGGNPGFIHVENETEIRFPGLRRQRDAHDARQPAG